MRPSPVAERPHVLVITNVLPSPHASAGEQRLIRLCQLLAARCQVSIVAPVASTGAPGRRDEQTRARAAELTRLGLLVPGSGGRHGLRKALVTRRYDGVLIEFWHVAATTSALVRRWQPRARLVVDTVDLELVRDRRGTEFAFGRDPGDVEIRRERELVTYEEADGLVFVSAEEQRVYRSLRHRPAHDWVVPILVSLRSRTVRPRPPTVLFVGNFWHAPNVDGIVWFSREVWPQVRAAVPGATLRVVGSNVWDEIARLSRLDGVEVVGFVEDLDAAYDEAALVVAPLRWGGGMKGKVCEAMASAVPVVTTDVGVEGLQGRPGVDLVVSAGPADMARDIVGLLADQPGAERMGAAGQAAIAGQCLPEVVAPVVADLVGFVTGRREGTPPRSWWLRASGAELSSAAHRLSGRRRRSRPRPG